MAYGLLLLPLVAAAKLFFAVRNYTGPRLPALFLVLTLIIGLPISLSLLVKAKRGAMQAAPNQKYISWIVPGIVLAIIDVIIAIFFINIFWSSITFFSA